MELVAPAIRLHRLLGDELRQGEQRLLRLRGVVVGYVVGDVLGGEVAAGAVDHVAHFAGVDEEGFVAAVLDRYETCPYGGTPDDEASFAIARLRVSGSETVAKVRVPPGLPIVYSNSWEFFLS